MRVSRAFAIAACVIVTNAGARAADVPGSWLPEIAKPITTELISGWYARADLGWRQQRFDSIEAASVPMTDWSVANAFTLGGGGGYKHKWFRIDATLDYGVPARFRGDIAGTPGYYSAKIDSFTLLANAYLDLGNWAGFTPYVGAGVGMTNLRVHEYVNGAILIPPDGVKDTSRWNMSWAWMAGISYRFSPNLLVDVSYRHLKLGDAMSGPEPPFYTTPTSFRDLSAREIRVGLRWMLD